MHKSPVPASNVAELEVSSRATKRANPESPNNVQQREEQPAADCRVGGSPSAPCLPITGGISSATADFDAVVTSDVEEKSPSSQTATPKASSNIEQLEQHPAADCQVGGSPSTHGEERMLLTPFFSMDCSTLNKAWL